MSKKTSHQFLLSQELVSFTQKNWCDWCVLVTYLHLLLIWKWKDKFNVFLWWCGFLENQTQFFKDHDSRKHIINFFFNLTWNYFKFSSFNTVKRNLIWAEFCFSAGSLIFTLLEVLYHAHFYGCWLFIVSTSRVQSQSIFLKYWTYITLHVLIALLFWYPFFFFWCSVVADCLNVYLSVYLQARFTCHTIWWDYFIMFWMQLHLLHHFLGKRKWTKVNLYNFISMKYLLGNWPGWTKF